MALQKGDKAPDFTLVDTDKKPHTLGEYLGKKTVLAFFPGAFTGVCTKEMCAFRDSITTLSSLNAQVVAVSVDSPFANKAFAEHNKLPFPVLSDYTKETSKKYAGLFEDFAGLKGLTVSNRGVFILDPKGIVTYVWIGATPGVEPPYDEITKALA